MEVVCKSGETEVRVIGICFPPSGREEKVYRGLRTSVFPWVSVYCTQGINLALQTKEIIPNREDEKRSIW